MHIVTVDELGLFLLTIRCRRHWLSLSECALQGSYSVQTHSFNVQLCMAQCSTQVCMIRDVLMSYVGLNPPESSGTVPISGTASCNPALQHFFLFRFSAHCTLGRRGGERKMDRVCDHALCEMSPRFRFIVRWHETLKNTPKMELQETKVNVSIRVNGVAEWCGHDESPS